MYDNYNYPPGADTPDAPWNQPDIPEKEFDVTISMSLSKTVSCFTNDYIPGASGCDYEPDGDGGYSACGWQDPDDISNTNWSEVYGDNHKTIPELLEELKKYIQKDLDNLADDETKMDKAFHRRRLEFLLNECEDWTVDEEDYEGE